MMQLRKPCSEHFLLGIALALLALALAGALRDTAVERGRSYMIAGRTLAAGPDETLRANDRNENAVLMADVPVAGAAAPVRAWLVRAAIAEAEPDFPDCAGSPHGCRREIAFDEDLRIIYRPPAGVPPEAADTVLRAWFAARLEPAEKAR